MSKKQVHVVPQGGSWAVKSTGASKASKVTSTQQEAVQVARKIAINNRAELVVHRQDGSIRSKDSFGNDPFPPRG
ncbi:MAG: hypothetical protein BGO01_08545 [Armatimonadetes bacterium 55-13]|nr:DUF2188 domain-containing protein [Armatimonadota bacterium]OJU62515.1 MAG: hypothetical protein BGO01_08545 [Armatimonadetes bacterium 55-13]